jgi:hypothetical protein
MKKLYLLALLFVFVGQSAIAQRFLEPTFDEVDITTNVPYGRNFTVESIPVTGHSSSQTLLMDVYQPANDDADLRPLVIYLHTGNFLPPIINGGVNGSKADSSNVEICIRLAKLGYVVASAEYRVGWNPFAPTQPERAFSLINAAYRGMQDARTAVRFFRKDIAENGNQYRIDDSRVTMFGQGSGSYLSFVGATLDDYNEIIFTSSPQGKFLTDLDGDTTTLEPMVIEAWNGDIYGTSVGIFPVNGDTFCIPNHVGYSSDIDLAINLGGALGDIAWLEEGDVPMISFHAPGDEFAPYDDDILKVGTTQDAIVQVQGSFRTTVVANDFGNNDIFLGMDIDPYTQGAIDASAAVGHDYMEALYPINRPINGFGRVESAPWEWWNPSPFDTIPHPFVAGFTINQVAVTGNVAMADPVTGKAQAMMYIDTIMGYIAPRAYKALDLENWSGTFDLLQGEEVGLELAPNPVVDFLNIETSVDNPMRMVEVFDVQGKLVDRITDIDASQYSYRINHTTAGLHLIYIHFDDGVVSEKVVIQ